MQCIISVHEQSFILFNIFPYLNVKNFCVYLYFILYREKLRGSGIAKIISKFSCKYQTNGGKSIIINDRM